MYIREQVDREQALNDFKTGVTRILIATDVASRGLDVKDITWVSCSLFLLHCFTNEIYSANAFITICCEYALVYLHVLFDQKLIIVC